MTFRTLARAPTTAPAAGGPTQPALRVALACGAYQPDQDGVADYLRRLAEHLPACGVAPVVVAGCWDLASTRRAVSRLAALHPDIVHVQFAPSAYGFRPWIGLLPLLAAADVPIVTTLHEYGWWSWPRGIGRVLGPVERVGWWDRETLALVPRSAAVLVTNAEHGAVVRRRFPRRPPPQLVPIGPNVDVVGADRNEVRSELGLAARAPVLAFFGFVHPVKGLRHLLDALPALRVERPDLRLLVIGGFTSLALPAAQAEAFERELRGQVAALGLTEVVTITGWQPAARVSRLLAAADAVVLPLTAGVTTKSGSLLIAGAHRLPVVATRGGDPALVDGQNAVLVDRVRDPAALVEGVRRVLADPGLAARVAAGGAAAAAGRSWPRIAAAHAALYRGLARARADQSA